MDENDTLRQIGTVSLGDELYGLSVHELEDRIQALRGEITRVERELEKKKSDRSAADSLFGTKRST